MIDRKWCSLCHDDYYNSSQTSGSSTGICWCRDDAKVVWRKEVSIDQRPPYTQKARRFPSCYHRPRYGYINQKDDNNATA